VEDAGEGWGNVVRIVHQLPDGKQVESLYAHLNETVVAANSWIKRGANVGTIGTANGAYLAHLHIEIRQEPNLPIGGGYNFDTTGYINPTAFIKAHRPIH
jgi:murein DD-endopeptidase MepM/ murein hydrolase activator NlpD